MLPPINFIKLFFFWSSIGDLSVALISRSLECFNIKKMMQIYEKKNTKDRKDNNNNISIHTPVSATTAAAVEGLNSESTLIIIAFSLLISWYLNFVANKSKSFLVAPLTHEWVVYYLIFITAIYFHCCAL